MLNSCALNRPWEVNEAFGGVEKEVPGAAEDDVDWKGGSVWIERSIPGG